MSDLENGTAEVVTQEPVTQTPEPTETTPVDLDAELGKVYDNANIPRSEDGKFASRNPEGDTPAQTLQEDKVLEGKPEGEAVEMAKTPSIDAPNFLPSELKAHWATVPPAVQEYVAKRETEAHKAITQLGQQVKAYEPFAKIVESNRDLFQNHRRNVQPEIAINALLQAQRELDRDPVRSIAMIAQTYGVDLSMFGNQSGEESNQSPQLASLNSRIEDLMARNAQLERLVLSREEREAQANQQSLAALIEDFAKANPIDDELEPSLVAQIHALNMTHPHLSQKEKLAMAYEQAKWANPALRQKIIAQERAALEAKKAKEQAELATKAKSASKLNVRSSPGDMKPVRTLDDVLSETYDRAQRA